MYKSYEEFLNTNEKRKVTINGYKNGIVIFIYMGKKFNYKLKDFIDKVGKEHVFVTNLSVLKPYMKGNYTAFYTLNRSNCVTIESVEGVKLKLEMCGFSKRNCSRDIMVWRAVQSNITIKEFFDCIYNNKLFNNVYITNPSILKDYFDSLNPNAVKELYKYASKKLNWDGCCYGGNDYDDPYSRVALKDNQVFFLYHSERGEEYIEQIFNKSDVNRLYKEYCI